MWRCRRVEVARCAPHRPWRGRGVFALEVRCRVMRLLVYSRVGKNRDTGGSTRRQPGRAAPPTTQRSSLARKFSPCGAPMTYTDLLGGVLFGLFDAFEFLFFDPFFFFYIIIILKPKPEFG